MNEEWLYIMDYANSDIYKLNISNMEYDNVEEVIEPYGLNADECAYMSTSSEIDNIKELTEKDKV